MEFTELQVSVSKHADLPKGLTPKAFLASTRHVHEALFANLPDDFVLDRAGVTEIRLGPRRDAPRYQRLDDRSLCYVEDFDFKKWKRSAAADKDELVLEALSSRLENIAHAFRADRGKLRDAAKQVRKDDFTARVTMPELSSEAGDRALRCEVFRTLSRKGEDWGLEVISRTGDVLDTVWLEEGADPVKVRKRFASHRWEGTVFQLLSSRGGRSFKLETVSFRQPAA